jgi:hypothetical protein
MMKSDKFATKDQFYKKGSNINFIQKYVAKAIVNNIFNFCIHIGQGRLCRLV